MNVSVEIQEYLTHFGGLMLLFLPVLFGTVEFIKDKMGFRGSTVEYIAVSIFVLFGGLVVAAYFYPQKGIQVAAIVLFLLSCALAPSGYYKFVSARAPKRSNDGQPAGESKTDRGVL